LKAAFMSGVNGPFAFAATMSFSTMPMQLTDSLAAALVLFATVPRLFDSSVRRIDSRTWHFMPSVESTMWAHAGAPRPEESCCAEAGCVTAKNEVPASIAAVVVSVMADFLKDEGL
jgi:hypothetical protein